MIIVTILRWMLCVPLSLLGFWINFANVAMVYLWLARGEHHSQAPFIGGIMGLFGMLLCPLPAIIRWAWVPPAVDIGWFTFCLVGGIVQLLFSRIRRKNDAADG